MKERALILPDAQAQAAYEGRLTHLRIVIDTKNHSQPTLIESNGQRLWSYIEWDNTGEPGHWIEQTFDPIRERLLLTCPYGGPGDRIWVRERWSTLEMWDGLKPSELDPRSVGNTRYLGTGYRAGIIRPAAHMPRFLSRTTLEVVSVDIERLQDITEAQMKGNGIQAWSKDRMLYKFWYTEPGEPGAPTWRDFPRCYTEAFHIHWDSRHPKGLQWADNPWVWAIDAQKMEDQSGIIRMGG